jgi:RNA processing factor Prp31
MENSRSEPAEKPKEAVFMYSTPLLICIFSHDLKPLQQYKVTEPEKALAALIKCEWFPEEAAAVKKIVSSGNSVVYLGSKNEKLEGVAFSQDVKKLDAASKAAVSDLPTLRESVISFTKKSISESVNEDNMIVQASSAITELNKAISLIVKRLREWFELYSPEISIKIPEHELFVAEILSHSKAEIQKKLGIPEKGNMGADLTKEHVDQILDFASAIKTAYESRKKISVYMSKVMQNHCPNITAVAGSQTGAELLTLAGSLYRLAILPSSTIQLLGAEKELFKHLKDKKERPPKFGIIHSHPMVISAPKQEQARIARLLADKISMAARIDYFKGKFIGDALLEDLKKKVEAK